MSNPKLPTTRPKGAASENTTGRLRVMMQADGAFAGPHVEHFQEGVRAMRLYDFEGYEAAVVSLMRAVDLEPNFAPAWAALAETYSHWGFRSEISGIDARPLYKMAFEAAQTAVRLAPERADAHRALAVALRRGEHADPVARRDESLTALDLDPKDASNWHEYWRAAGYQLPDGAIERCLEIDPRHGGARIDLGAALFSRGRFSEAAREFTLALQINPRSTLASYNLAMALGRLGNRPTAVQVVRRALKVRPDDRLLTDALKDLGEASHG